MMTRLAALFSLLALSLAAVAVHGDEADEAAIRQSVERAYVRGVHIDADPELMRGGMHEMFVMFIRGDKGVTQMTRDAWIERIEASKARAAANAPRPETTAEVAILDRTEDAAVVKVKLFRDGKQIFTDYISLYRVEGDWKLVGKIFQRH